ncbi:MAG TPA: SpoIID/LytB domain-containing protein [Candidatus Cloacimonetes bacterium]|nr:SpoIID/LytB domain-containing protein [Candidatus Cloacimonadota bacterium]
MNRALVILILLFGVLSAAEIRDNELYLEINIAVDNQIIISGEDIFIQEQDPFFAKEYSGSIRITLPTSTNDSRYGIIQRVVDESVRGYIEGIRSSKFVWEEGKLALKNEYAIYLDQSFRSYEEAQQLAMMMGYPESHIQQIPIVNASLRVDSDSGDQEYFESPIRIYAEDGIQFGNITYKGEFIVKAQNGKLVFNHLLPLETYIAGVVPNEIGNSSPAEALKAQAVAARSHAVSLLGYNRHAKDGYDLCSTTHCQVYKGEHLQNEAIQEAVHETAGEILYIDDKVADATYHSSCGGKTDSSVAIWNGTPLSHLSGSTCLDAARNIDLSREPQAIKWINTSVSTQGMTSWERAGMNWQRSISKAQLTKNLGLTYLTSVQIMRRGASGRILSIKFYGDRTIELSGEYRIRQAFGGLPSSLFYIQGISSRSKHSLGNKITLKGRGSGHGVGMCQVGALRRARADEDYKSILQNYYPQTTIITDWMKQE